MTTDQRASGDKDGSSVAEGERFVTRSVTSEDGTVIGYRQLGQGPGLVLLHGTMSSGQNHVEIAETLADAFTVYLPDRRGRGQSGPFGKDYSVAQEVADLAALLAATGTRQVFGVSSGGIISLQAALNLPIRKVAVWEPPLFMDRSVPAAVLTRFDQEMAEGNVAAALITAMKGAQMGPRIFNFLPRRLLTWLTGRFMAMEEKKGPGDYVPMRELAPTLHYDLQLVLDSSGDIGGYGLAPAEVLLLGGSKSPGYLKAALDALEKVLPRARRVEFPGLDHAASWNSDRGGRPELLAHEVRSFFQGRGR